MATFPELHGRNILITGGANGIGAAMVRTFHEQGAHVFFCDLDVPAGRKLERACGSHAEFAKVDLRREQEVVRWIKRIRSEQRAIHVLINNAASDPRIALRDMSASAWDDLMMRNLRACFLTAREAVPAMKPGASIINFSSITFHIAPPEMTAYVATKAGIIGFTRALARELGPRRIRVNTLSPGWIMTERQLRQFVTPAVRRLIKRSQCSPDLIQPEEIANVALFLASDASTAITGQEILVDRGWAFS